MIVSAKTPRPFVCDLQKNFLNVTFEHQLMMRHQPFRLFLLLISFLFLTNCYYHRKNEDYSSAATVTPHFSSINPGIIQAKCMPCHDASQKGGRDFSSYNGVFAHIVPGSASGSAFYTQVQNGSMPIDRPMLNDDEILAIYQWIQNGAPND